LYELIKISTDGQGNPQCLGKLQPRALTVI